MRCRAALLAVVVLGLLAFAPGCTDSDGGASAVPAVTAIGPADYTIVGKATYGGAGVGKRGYYVTIMLFGKERETEVPWKCYDAAVVGQVLPAEIPGIIAKEPIGGWPNEGSRMFAELGARGVKCR